MEKLDYESPGTKSELPVDMEFAYGFFPAMAALLLAALAAGAGFIASIGFMGAAHSVGPLGLAVIIGITAGGWILTIIVLKRPHGLLTGIIALIAQLGPTFFLLYFAYRMIF